MALIDFQQPGRFQEPDGFRRPSRAGPRPDGLGLGLFAIHALVGFYILSGWLFPSHRLLGFYLILLPAVALQWRLNHGCCVLNNLESRIRTGKWRDPANKEEGAFLLMISEWLFQVRPSPLFLDRLSYCAILVLWLLGFAHLAALTMT